MAAPNYVTQHTLLLKKLFVLFLTTLPDPAVFNGLKCFNLIIELK